MGEVVALNKRKPSFNRDTSKFRIEARANPTGDVWAVCVTEKINSYETKERQHQVMARCTCAQVYQVIDTLMDLTTGEVDLTNAPFIVPGSYRRVRILN